MERMLMNEEELENTRAGEAITLTAVLTVLAIAVVAVIVYKLWTSSKGSTTLPGGYKFEWK